jgi:hypothetical protein
LAAPPVCECGRKIILDGLRLFLVQDKKENLLVASTEERAVELINGTRKKAKIIRRILNEPAPQSYYYPPPPPPVPT